MREREYDIYERTKYTGGMKMEFSSVKVVVRDLVSSGKGWILISVGAGWFLAHGSRVVYPALIPFFQTEFQISLAVAGLLLTTLTAAYALGQLPGGILGDRIGEGNILVISTVASACAVLIVGIAHNVWMLFFASIVFGLATALYGPTRFTIFTEIYSQRRGSAIGLTMAAGSAGDAILPITATVIAMYISWRVSFGILCPLFLLVALATWLTVPGRVSSGENVITKFSVNSIRQILRGIAVGAIPTVVSIQLFMSLVTQGFIGFFPTYLVIEKGFTPTVATAMFTLFFVVSFVIQPLSGICMDTIGTRKALILFLVLSVIGLWLLPFVHGTVQLVALTFFLGSLRGYTPITQTYITETLPDGMKGTGLGTLRTGFILFGSLSPVFIGVLGDGGYFNEAFVAMAGIGSIGLLLTVIKFR